MAKLLSVASTLTCPHQGTVDVSQTSNDTVRVGGDLVLLTSDVHSVRGCAFMQGNKPSPCMTVCWTNGSGEVRGNTAQFVTDAATGTCRSAEQAPQGTVTVVETQGDVTIG